MWEIAALLCLFITALWYVLMLLYTEWKAVRDEPPWEGRDSDLPTIPAPPPDITPSGLHTLPRIPKAPRMPEGMGDGHE
jgi:hypothetical protein